MESISVKLDMALMRQPGAGSMNDRVDENLLGPVEASSNKGFQTTRGAMEKQPGFQRLTGATPVGFSMRTTRVLHGAKFPYIAAYNLGKRWSIKGAYRVTSVPSSGTDTLFWRAHTDNTAIITVLLNTSGQVVVTHRDDADVEVTFNSTRVFIATDEIHWRVTRWGSKLHLYLDGRKDHSRKDLSATENTKQSTTAFFVGIDTATDGNNASAQLAADGDSDDVAVFNDNMPESLGKWSYAEYPWLSDPRLVLYAKFNSDAFKDYSSNANTGSQVGSAPAYASPLVAAVAPILKLFQLVATDGTQQWCIWTDGSFYAISGDK